MTSSSEAGAAVRMSDSTDRWVWMETPQFPRAIPPRYASSCTATGRSRPRNFRAAATWAAEACGPAQVAAGSPGTRCATAKVTTMAPTITTTASAIRRATKTSIVYDSLMTLGAGRRRR